MIGQRSGSTWLHRPLNARRERSWWPTMIWTFARGPPAPRLRVARAAGEYLSSRRYSAHAPVGTQNGSDGHPAGSHRHPARRDRRLELLLARSLRLSRTHLAAGWNEAEPGGLVRQLVGQSAKPTSPPRDVYFGEKSDDEMCMCYFQVTARTFAEMQMLENDMTLYIREQMEQYRQGMARRGAPIARPSAPPQRSEIDTRPPGAIGGGSGRQSSCASQALTTAKATAPRCSNGGRYGTPVEYRRNASLSSHQPHLRSGRVARTTCCPGCEAARGCSIKPGHRHGHQSAVMVVSGGTSRPMARLRHEPLRSSRNSWEKGTLSPRWASEIFLWPRVTQG